MLSGLYDCAVLVTYMASDILHLQKEVKRNFLDIFGELTDLHLLRFSAIPIIARFSRIQTCDFLFNPRPTGGGGIRFRAPPLVFLRYLLNLEVNRYRPPNLQYQGLSMNNLSHIVF